MPEPGRPLGPPPGVTPIRGGLPPGAFPTPPGSYPPPRPGYPTPPGGYPPPLPQHPPVPMGPRPGPYPPQQPPPPQQQPPHTQPYPAARPVAPLRQPYPPTTGGYRQPPPPPVAHPQGSVPRPAGPGRQAPQAPPPPSAVPQQHPRETEESEAPGLTYVIEGEHVPVLHLNLDGRMPVFFEHRAMLWKHPRVNVVLRPPAGQTAASPQRPGGPARPQRDVQFAHASGKGRIAFSRDSSGQVVAMEIAEGGSLMVRGRQFLAATNTLTVSSLGSGSGGLNYSIDRFAAARGGGVLWLHTYGNAFEVELEAGEAFDLDPAAWLYHEATVTVSQQVIGGSGPGRPGAPRLVVNRFFGPGRVGFQSGSVRPESTAAAVAEPGAARPGAPAAVRRQPGPPPMPGTAAAMVGGPPRPPQQSRPQQGRPQQGRPQQGQGVNTTRSTLQIATLGVQLMNGLMRF